MKNLIKISNSKLIKLLIVIILLHLFLYTNPKGQYLEIKDKNGATYEMMFHKGILNYTVFKDEKKPSKGILLIIWKWEIESIKTIQ